jgi:hypothetical protein
MPRPPIGKRAMTPAERQRRRRKKLRKEKLALGSRAENERRRLKAAETYMLMPPGITYWREVEVLTADGPRKILTPTTKPLPSLQVSDLDDSDVIQLLRQLTRAAIARGLLKPGEPVPVMPMEDAGAKATAELLQATQTRELEPGEGCTIGPVP